jgi:hypothetical protein
LWRRSVGHRPRVVERIGAHRAANRRQHHGCHRRQRPCPRKRAPCHSCLNHAVPSRWRDPFPTGRRRPPQRPALAPSTGRHVPDLTSGCSPSPTPTHHFGRSAVASPEKPFQPEKPARVVVSSAFPCSRCGLGWTGNRHVGLDAFGIPCKPEAQAREAGEPMRPATTPRPSSP